MAKILLVEDEENLLQELSLLLAGEGHVIDTARDGLTASEMLKTFVYELLILDVNLPEIGGIEVCSNFRKSGRTTPVLMLTGRTTISDKERGLDSGADDYLTKPFNSRELLARIRALLRRAPNLNASELRHDDLLVDTAGRCVRRGDKEIRLWPKEYDILVFLLRNRDHIFDSDALTDRLWPMESEVSPEAIRQSIKRLRQKIDLLGESSIITTVKGFGYTIRSDGSEK
ncbi:MAG: response regulator transcription factor [Candidatus Obscuribacterales bacterium]|nr:response regulator transcription factor [Candidatus Obscuribacterales bacterium]